VLPETEEDRRRFAEAEIRRTLISIRDRASGKVPDVVSSSSD
jgi:hypothetical protein